MIEFKNESDIRKYVADTLDAKIQLVIKQQLHEWFMANIKEIVDRELKNQFKKIMIVKFGED